MDIGAERVNLMTNSVNGIQREINIKGQKPGTVISFRYLGAVSGGGFKPAILKRHGRSSFDNYERVI